MCGVFAVVVVAVVGGDYNGALHDGPLHDVKTFITNYEYTLS